jgi:hypothetical protein
MKEDVQILRQELQQMVRKKVKIVTVNPLRKSVQDLRKLMRNE